VQSNTLFDEQGGTTELRSQPPPGVFGGQGGAGGAAAGGMPPMGGMGGAGGMPPMGGAGGAGGMPPMGGMGGAGGAGGGGGLPPGMPPGGIPPHLQQMMGNMNPAMMQNLMQRFGGMGGMGGQGPPAAQEPRVGEVCQVANNAHLQKLIKDCPGLIVDFWSQTCPPCMRIKPTFEAAAKANDNENLVFAAVDTQQARDAA